MANRTVKEANTMHGTNPQYLVEKIIRSRIYDSKYWKEFCFALTAELLVDRAMELRFIGGTYGGNIKVTPFLCLLLKMLQIQPDKDIVVEFIKQQDFKYVRCLGAMYLRLTCSSVDCYSYLEPLLVDYRKVRIMNLEGKFLLSYVDDFIDQLLNEDKVCSIILPRLTKRTALEDTNLLEPKVSALEEDLEYEDDDASSEEDAAVEEEVVKPRRRRDRSLSAESPPAHKRAARRKSRSRERRSKSRSRDRNNRRGGGGARRDRSSSPRSKKDTDKRSSGKSGVDEFQKGSLSMSDSNKLRASLGLAPLVE